MCVFNATSNNGTVVVNKEVFYNSRNQRRCLKWKKAISMRCQVHQSSVILDGILYPELVYLDMKVQLLLGHSGEVFC